MKAIQLMFLFILTIAVVIFKPSFTNTPDRVDNTIDLHIEDKQHPAEFNAWLKSGLNSRRANQYERYLISHLGYNNVPPMSQMLRTARSWKKCRQPRYQVPPRYLWKNMLPTLRLYVKLKRQGILPRDTYIRSTYRNSRLNRCAGGAPKSSHRYNQAVDVWSPSFERSRRITRRTQNKICKFWRLRGKGYKFGLGVYETGSIHIDSKEYRIWGRQHTSRWSYCRR